MNTLAHLFQTWWPWGERRARLRANHLCITCRPSTQLSCPVCGYYCLGRGGLGCIDKPFLTGLE